MPKGSVLDPAFVCFVLRLYPDSRSHLLFYRLRYATPAEEASVSWRVRPSGLDRGLALEIAHHRERLVDPYLDVDGDEQLLREQRTARKEKRKALMEAAGVAK